MTDLNYDIYLSYNRADTEVISQLAERLADAGLRVWFDRWCLPLGASWVEASEAALRDSATLAICISTVGISGFALEERNVFVRVHPEGNVVPILLPGANPASLPQDLAAIACVDLGRGFADSEAIGRLLSLVYKISKRHDNPAEECSTARSELSARSDAPSLRTRALTAIGAPPPPPEAVPRINAEDALQDSAKRILRGEQRDPAELLKLASALKKARDFTTARRLLARARDGLITDPALRLKIGQQHALCTYKDPNLPADDRLQHALEILGEVDPPDATKNQETLGLTGAIHKRRWEVDGQRQHLERALFYYKRGFNQGVAGDFGYTGINAAFVLDLLANEEEREAAKAGAQSEGAQRRRQLARDMRTELVSELQRIATAPEHSWLTSTWWFLVTMAEACFGLDQYDDATAWLAKARQLPDVADWEYETTARQLARLAHLQNKAADARAKSTLREFLGERSAAMESVLAGKIGLALSGGGFRASLFHIGVLARLAELDVLRQVEVLSCVSGGSIIGAHYYLEVRHLLQTKSDQEITQQDYIEIIRRVEREFLAGVQRNLRTRVISSLIGNARMIFQPSYSRTVRLGELYEAELFNRVPDGQAGARWLNRLFIQPKGGPAEFLPKVDNWARANKAPVLILNATCLNTAHNWQFTASWMGEPPTSIDSEVDGNERLRRMYYEDAPEPHRNIRLGQAVAASSCVPGLFTPITLDALYPGKIVRLVDGGVYDNQGISALLGEDCTVLLVSDASGQITTTDKPKSDPLSVPLRANDILMARVRSSEYHDLDGRRRSSLLHGLMYIHLKKDLDVDPVDWIGCDDPFEASENSRPIERRGALTTYGMRKDVQREIAGIRTDLDSFSDAEAFALMISGYRMAAHEFGRAIKDVPVKEQKVAWRFMEIGVALDKTKGADAEYKRIRQILRIAGARAFKVWQLSRPLKIFGVAMMGSAAIAMIVAIVKSWNAALPLLTVGAIVKVFLALVFAAMAPAAYRVIHYGDTIRGVIKNLILATLGILVAWLHLAIFDRIYLALGRSTKVVPPSKR